MIGLRHKHHRAVAIGRRLQTEENNPMSANHILEDLRTTQRSRTRTIWSTRRLVLSALAVLASACGDGPALSAPRAVPTSPESRRVVELRANEAYAGSVWATGRPLHMGKSFTALDAARRPVAGVTVSFVAEGGGAIERLTDTTDAQGTVDAGPWLISAKEGWNRLIAREESGVTSTLSVEAVTVVSGATLDGWYRLVRIQNLPVTGTFVPPQTISGVLMLRDGVFDAVFDQGNEVVSGRYLHSADGLLLYALPASLYGHDAEVTIVGAGVIAVKGSSYWWPVVGRALYVRIGDAK